MSKTYTEVSGISPHKKTKKTNLSYDINTIRKDINKLMQREETREEMEANLKKIKHADGKMAWKNWWIESAKDVECESQLRLLSNPVWLKFVYDNKEKGMYYIRTVTNDGKIICKPVDPAWVQDNFTLEAIAMVQRIARDTKEIIEDSEGQKEVGYIDISQEIHEDYDGQEISKIRYIPERTIMRGGKLIQVAEAWKGMIRSHIDNNVTFISLSSQWIDENFATDFIQMMKDLNTVSKHKGYVRIPEGRNKLHDIQPLITLNQKETDSMTSTMTLKMPILTFQLKSTPTLHSCLCISAASALAYNEYKTVAQSLGKMGWNNQCLTNPFTPIYDCFRSKILSSKKERMELEVHRIKNPHNFDPIGPKRKALIMIIVIGSDDSIAQHAISISKDIIFDAKSTNGIQLTMENWKACCLSVTTNYDSIKIQSGVLINRKLPTKSNQITNINLEKEIEICDASTHNQVVKLPKLKFQQTEKPLLRACLYFSAASALYYNGYTTIAKNLGRIGWNNECVLNPYTAIYNCWRNKSLSSITERRELYVCNIKHPNNFNPLEQTIDYVVAVITIQSDDNKTDHCLSISNKFIFDANFKHCLHLTLENLHKCCSTDTRKNKYVSVKAGVLFIKQVRKTTEETKKVTIDD